MGIIEHDGGGNAWAVRVKTDTEGGSMDWLHLMCDIASVEAICAGPNDIHCGAENAEIAGNVEKSRSWIVGLPDNFRSLC
jgi:hypothetical protein